MLNRFRLMHQPEYAVNIVGTDRQLEPMKAHKSCVTGSRFYREWLGEAADGSSSCSACVLLARLSHSAELFGCDSYGSLSFRIVLFPFVPFWLLWHPKYTQLKSEDRRLQSTEDWRLNTRRSIFAHLPTAFGQRETEISEITLKTSHISKLTLQTQRCQVFSDTPDSFAGWCRGELRQQNANYARNKRTKAKRSRAFNFGLFSVGESRKS